MPRLLLAVGVLLAAVALLASASGPAAWAQGSGTVEVLDTAGRYVAVPTPVERVVVLWPNPAEMVRALGAAERIVGIDTDTAALVEQGLYPELADAQVVGSWDEPNFEAIAGLDPDVVVMLATYTPTPDEVQASLDDFDIPVVGLDFFKVEVLYQELRTLGILLDLREEASELVDFFSATIDDIVGARLADLEGDRPTVFFEGAGVYQTYGGAGDGTGIPGLVRAGGGIDLYPEVTQAGFDADPEDVALRNPDVIVKGDPRGYFLDDERELEALRAEILARPELAGTTAVGQGQVYVMSFDVAGGARKIFGPAFMAKILYPDLFADFDPHDFLREYLTRFQGLDWRGVYVVPALPGAAEP